MNNRPYGHGYLGAAYIGYLANGGGAVTSANIAQGMDKIFTDLLNGQSLENAIQKNAGISTANLNSLFNSGDQNLTEFVHKLSYEARDGAGSVITTGLDVGGSSLLGNNASALNQPFRIDPFQVTVNASGPSDIGLQVGAEPGQHIEIDLYQMSSQALGLEDMNVRSTDDADRAIDQLKYAIGCVSNVRSQYGAIQNRLEHTINNLNNITENTTEAESRIRDADIAAEMMEYSNNQILMQAGASMLAQANQHSQLILSLLG